RSAQWDVFLASQMLAAWPEWRSRFALVNRAIVHWHRPRPGSRHSLAHTSFSPATAPPFLPTPANNAQFHVAESFNIQWSSVVNAQSYILEADDEPTFSYPLTLQLEPISFGTQSGAIWENALTIFYRVRAVSVDGVRSLPSATRTVQITNAAPIPAVTSPVAPAGGATVQV